MDQRPLAARGVTQPDRLQIPIDTLREDRDTPHPRPIRETVTLKEILDKYTLTLGLQNAHLVEVVATLMTTGKVWVEFRAYTERLQLKNASDAISRPAALELFDEYLARSKEKKAPSRAEGTRRITVQLPKIVLEPDGTPRRAPPTP
jgi:hypothetical protein